LKTLIKYPLSLFILLLIAYSQLFAPLYRGSAPSAPAKKEIEQGQALDVKSADAQTIFIAEQEEEEDDRISFKRNLEESSVFSYIHVPDYLGQQGKSNSSFTRDFSSCIFSGPTYLIFRVFRL